MSRSGVRISFPARRPADLRKRHEHRGGSACTAWPETTTERRAPKRKHPKTAAPGSLASLLPSWERSVRAQRKSPKTIRGYLDSAGQLLGFLESAGMPTVATRYRGLQQLFTWLLEEGETERSPMERMKPPSI